MLPAPAEGRKGVIIVLGQLRVAAEPLLAYFKQGRVVQELDAKEVAGGSTRVLASRAAELAPHGADVVFDALGGSKLAKRMRALMTVLRYQGLYIADDIARCVLAPSDAAAGEQKRGKRHARGLEVDSCPHLLNRIAQGLHRPHGAGRGWQREGRTKQNEFHRCWDSERDCDLPVESMHAFPGLLVIRKGQVHPLWDPEAAAWQSRSIRDNSRSDNAVGKRREVPEVVRAAQQELRPLHKQADERADGCWSGRHTFYHLCRRHDADKGDHHAYWRGYGALMQTFREKPGVRVAELGLSHGSSLYVWIDWFGKDAEIHSVDMKDTVFAAIRRKIHPDAQSRVHLHAVNSPIRDWWEADFDWEGTTRSSRIITTAAGESKFDIIVDDAGHSPLQNAMFFHDLAPLLRPGGLFVCEDLAAGAFMRLKGKDQERLPAAIRDLTTPMDLFITVTRNILLRGPEGAAEPSACGGCDAALVSAHWWDETVVFERATS